MENRGFFIFLNEYKYKIKINKEKLLAAEEKRGEICKRKAEIWIDRKKWELICGMRSHNFDFILSINNTLIISFLKSQKYYNIITFY